MRNAEGAPETSLQLKMQMDYLTAQKHDLQQEMKGVREDATQTLRELGKATEKVFILLFAVILLLPESSCIHNLTFRVFLYIVYCSLFAKTVCWNWRSTH